MNTINYELVNSIKKQVPQGANIIDLITDIIPISKEAAYRRLRGDIHFTIDEAIAICIKLGISLDHLIETQQQDRFTFHISPQFSEEPLAEYYKLLNRIHVEFTRINEHPNAFTLKVHNTLPLTFSFNYDHLIKIKLFKWIYHSYSPLTGKKLEKILIPEKIIDKQRSILQIIQKIPTSLVLSENTFISLANDILYFKNLELISDEEINIVKQELHSMINDMEVAEERGSFDSGTKVEIYISQIFIDATYIYSKNDNYSICGIQTYGINSVICLNKTICDNQHKWINSLIRFSIPASKSQFFNKQREIINSI